MENSEELREYLDSVSLFRQKLIEECKLFLSLIENESNELKRIREVYGLCERSTFNFFEPLDKYWREDFHEIILMQILNPNTVEIGNIAYLHKFTDLLHSINESYDQNNRFNKSISVERQVGDEQYGHIDILISDDSRAIIIESKINDAEDRPDQLARYYQYVTKVLEKEVTAIVYLRPVYKETKMPPLDDYSDKYKEEVNEIEKLLIPVSIVDSKKQLDLCHSFLDNCYKIANSDKAKIYIEQYSELLKILGGNKMIMNIEKDLFKKLFENEDSIRKVADIAEVWNKRRLIFAALIQDALIKEQGFCLDDERRVNKERYIYKSIKEANEDVSLAFIYGPDSDCKEIRGNYVFGFSFYTKEKEKYQETIKNLLEGIGFESSLDKDIKCIEYSDKDSLLFRRLCFEINKPVDELIKDVLNMYAQLYEKAIKRIEDLKSRS
ncbi:MAG: PD-(D/E)XK nuclease family protein [Treponema sp.]|nr:PD-(D/E)XK nuclease family protein [Treponema sp.]